MNNLVMNRIQTMPKVEIHVHLEGAIDAETVFEMARRNGKRLPVSTLSEWKDFYRFTNFSHFIDVYAAATSVMLTPDDWSFMVENFVKNQAAQNILYSEVFISKSMQTGCLSNSELLAALSEGVSKGEKQYGSRVKFIPDISRHMLKRGKVCLNSFCSAKRPDSSWSGSRRNRARIPPGSISRCLLRKPKRRDYI